MKPASHGKLVHGRRSDTPNRPARPRPGCCISQLYIAPNHGRAQRSASDVAAAASGSGVCMIAAAGGVRSWGVIAVSGRSACTQIVEHDSRVPMPRVKDMHARAILEGRLGRLLCHPNIVAGFGTFSGAFPHERLCIPGSTMAADGPDRNVTLLLQELCNRGTLRAALQSGALYAGAEAAAAAAGDAADAAAGAQLRRLKVLAQAARQVAFGLSHMHAYHVVHCDLNASNVFLQAVVPESGAAGSPRLAVSGLACMRPATGGANRVRARFVRPLRRLATVHRESCPGSDVAPLAPLHRERPALCAMSPCC